MTDPRPCARCTETFTPSGPGARGSYCLPCRNAAHYEWKQRQAAAKDTPLVWVCQSCGRDFTGRKRRHCTPECLYKAKWPNRAHRRPVEFTNCPTCDLRFQITHTRAKYCSKSCTMKARVYPPPQNVDADRMRRYRPTREPYKRIDIYTRDKWRCHLCGKKTRRNAKPPHPLAPSLDHVIPLSQGGSDTPANVRCAHLRCNAAKGNRALPTGEQLMLIG